MLVELQGDWDASSNDDVLPGQQSIWTLDTRETDKSIIEISPSLTIKTAPTKTPAPRTGPAAKVLDKIAPRKTDAAGKVRIWGMPPAVAYLLMALAVGGVGYVAVRSFSGGGRRVATNPRRRRGRGRQPRGRKR